MFRDLEGQERRTGGRTCMEEAPARPSWDRSGVWAFSHSWYPGGQDYPLGFSVSFFLHPQNSCPVGSWTSGRGVGRQVKQTRLVWNAFSQLPCSVHHTLRGLTERLIIHHHDAPQSMRPHQGIHSKAASEREPYRTYSPRWILHRYHNETAGMWMEARGLLWCLLVSHVQLQQRMEKPLADSNPEDSAPSEMKSGVWYAWHRVQTKATRAQCWWRWCPCQWEQGRGYGCCFRRKPGSWATSDAFIS